MLVLYFFRHLFEIWCFDRIPVGGTKLKKVVYVLLICYWLTILLASSTLVVLAILELYHLKGISILQIIALTIMVAYLGFAIWIVKRKVNTFVYYIKELDSGCKT